MATEVMTAPEGRIIHKTYAVLSGAAIPQRVYVTQYDESLPVIACTLYKDGQLYTIQDGASVRLRMNKNGLPVYHEAIGIDDTRHVVYLEITAQMTVLYGEFAMVLEVETSDGKTAGTSYLRLIVRQNPVQNPELDNIPDYTANSNKLTAEGVKKLQDESSMQQKAIEDKGKNTLESIPADYSTLSGKVDKNTSGISQLNEDLGELENDLGLTIPHNLFNKDYAEDGYDYNGGFLNNASVDTSTGEIKPDGTRYVSYPIRIYKNSSIYFVGGGSQTTCSIVGFLQYDSSGNFVEFVNTAKIENTNVKNGYIRIIMALSPSSYLRVCYSEYISETHTPYFDPYYSKLRDIDENKSTIGELSSRVTELEEKSDNIGITLVDCEYESGLFNGSGTNATPAYESIRVAESISTNENEMLFIYVKAGYILVINDTGLDGTQKNLVFSNHLSYSTNGRSIRIGAYRSDKSQILDSFSEIIKVYKFKPKNAHELYDICIAASDSEKIYKDKADIICDGANDQFLIQCSIFNYRRTNKVLLYPGNYNITEIRDNPYSKDGLYGHKVVFSTQNPENVYVTNTIHIDGYMRHIIQQESIGSVNIRFTDECWDSIDENGEQISVIGGEFRAFYQRRFALHMSCLNFWGNDAKKPVVFVDGYYATNMQIEKVNVMSEKTTFGAYTYIPNELHNGFRGMQGSPYGTNYIKNSLAWKCGIGYNIGGEHFVLEDAGACFCGIGFAFSHYYGRIKMQHNNIMIKCVVSQCMRSIILDRYGLQEESEDELKNTTQMLECIGLQLESSFTTEGLSDRGYSDGAHNTEGIYEVHNGTWYGTITLQTIAKAVAKGCKNIRVTIVMLPTAGTLSERPSISKVANYTEFYDVENNKKYIAYDGEWRRLN